MAFLIDGYNLLNATDIFGAEGPGSLERSRYALLDFLATALGPRAARRTTVVFDGKSSPPGLVRVTEHRGICVRYARRTEEADDLLEALIDDEADPRHLTVVSSDHRVQRAARRRGATIAESVRWFRELRRHPPGATEKPVPEKPVPEKPSPPNPHAPFEPSDQATSHRPRAAGPARRRPSANQGPRQPAPPKPPPSLPREADLEQLLEEARRLLDQAIGEAEEP